MRSSATWPNRLSRSRWTFFASSPVPAAPCLERHEAHYGGAKDADPTRTDRCEEVGPPRPDAVAPLRLLFVGQGPANTFLQASGRPSIRRAARLLVIQSACASPGFAGGYHAPRSSSSSAWSLGHACHTEKGRGQTAPPSCGRPEANRRVSSVNAARSAPEADRCPHPEPAPR